MYYYSSTPRTTTNENCINNFLGGEKGLSRKRYFVWNNGWNNYVCFDRLPQYGGNQVQYQGYQICS